MQRIVVGQHHPVRNADEVLYHWPGKHHRWESVPSRLRYRDRPANREFRDMRERIRVSRSHCVNGDGTIMLPLAASPSARSIIRCDNRRASAISPISYFPTSAPDGGEGSMTSHRSIPVVRCVPWPDEMPRGDARARFPSSTGRAYRWPRPLISRSSAQVAKLVKACVQAGSSDTKCACTQ